MGVKACESNTPAFEGASKATDNAVKPKIRIVADLAETTRRAFRRLTNRPANRATTTEQTIRSTLNSVSMPLKADMFSAKRRAIGAAWAGVMGLSVTR